MKLTKPKKIQKPIEFDAQFRFICPQHDCGFDHWLSLKQCQAKNFKIVCECGHIFKPKRVLKIKILYTKTKNNNNHKSETLSVSQISADSASAELTEPLNDQPESIISYPSEYLKTTSIKILGKYGFTDEESYKLVINAFAKNPIDNVSHLVRYILENIKLLETNNEQS